MFAVSETSSVASTGLLDDADPIVVFGAVHTVDTDCLGHPSTAALRHEEQTPFAEVASVVRMPRTRPCALTFFPTSDRNIVEASRSAPALRILFTVAATNRAEGTLRGGEANSTSGDRADDETTGRP